MKNMKRYFGLFLFTLLSCIYAQGAVPSVKVYQNQIPVLAGKDMNRALVIEIIPADGTPFTLEEITIGLRDNDNLEDIRSVRVFRSSKRLLYEPVAPYGSRMKPASEVTFTGRITCAGNDKINLWVFLEMNEAIDLRNKYTVECLAVKTPEGEAKIVPVHPKRELRPGVIVRDKGDDGVHTYRIPGIVTTNEGTLLAIYDVRYDSNRDLQGHMDIGLSRSTDKGLTWEPMKIIMDRGRWGGLPEKFNGISDANILVDRVSGDILVTGLWMHGILDKDGKWIENLDENSDQWIHQWNARGSQPGYSVKQTSQVLQTRSSDDGKTWSPMVNLTKMGKKGSWWLWAPSPGNGITLDDGTLVMPTQGRDESGEGFSNIAWSRDHGRTWQSSKPAYKGTSESTVVQLPDGSLMLNMRLGANKENEDHNGRAICVTRDFGRKWSEHPTSRKALIEPACMGNLYKHSYDGGKKSILLFSNPDSKHSRINHGIKISFDDGMTWPAKHRILLDELRSAGYSCMTSVDEQTIGILYESSQAHLIFQLVGLEEILNPAK